MIKSTTEPIIISGANAAVRKSQKDTPTNFVDDGRGNLNMNELASQSSDSDITTVDDNSSLSSKDSSNTLATTVTAPRTPLTEDEEEFLKFVSRGKVLEVDKLLQRGVDIKVCNSFDRDAMQIAARNGHLNMLKLLLSFGGNIQARSTRGETLCHLACYSGNVEVIKWLFESGASMDCRDHEGSMPIHISARRAEFAILQYFHETLHLDMDIQNGDGLRPLDLVPRHDIDGSEACKNYLLHISGMSPLPSSIVTERNRRRGLFDFE